MLMTINTLKDITEDKIVELVDQFSTESYYGLPVLHFEDCSKWIISTGNDFEIQDSLEMWIDDHAHELSPEILSKGTGIPEIMFELLIEKHGTDSTLDIIYAINASCGTSSFASFLVNDYDVHGADVYHFLSGGKEWTDIGEEGSNCKAFRLS